MIKDNHDPRKSAIFRKFSKEQSEKAKEQQEDFNKIVEILTYNIF